MSLRKEIGSEFWDVPTGSSQNGVFPNETKWFLSGRSALQAIIAENGFKSVALPDWCCDSMILPFLNSKITLSFYDALHPPRDFDTDAILVMDYFGYSSDRSYDGYNGVVIRDLTHSLFSKQYNDADYYFGSLRKWAGFYTGGYAWGFGNEVSCGCLCEPYTVLRREAMKEKKAYISGITDSKKYLVIFAEAEEILENIGVAPAEERDIELASMLDVDFIRSAHRRNAKMLMNAFSDNLIFSKMTEDDCPMFVPIRVKNRNELRRALIEKKIYCPVHWPISTYHRLSKETSKLCEEELSLVCDQRYCERDIERMIDTIRKMERK